MNQQIEALKRTNEINWMLRRAEVVRPYAEEDYVEMTFEGTLPHRMGEKVRNAMAAFAKMNSEYVVVENDGSVEEVLIARFGNTNRTRNTIVLHYSREAL